GGGPPPRPRAGGGRPPTAGRAAGPRPPTPPPAAAGGPPRLPAAALGTAQDSVGGGLAVAERLATDPAAGPEQAQALADAVHRAFAQGVSTTSLVGGVIMAAGTAVVLAVLPGRRARKAAQEAAQEETAEGRDAEPSRSGG
ncbi:hypothetical protein ACFXAQ_09885, partial [Streptomyces olivaceus]